MSEARLRMYLENNVDCMGHFTFIESHASSPGVPDVAYTVRGFNGWMELKYGSPQKPPHLRQMQWVWIKRNLKSGGNPLILALIDDGKSKEFGLIHGSGVDDIYLKKSNRPWLDAMAVKWHNAIDWQQFMHLLCNPEELV